jgi:hypothetical protein
MCIITAPKALCMLGLLFLVPAYFNLTILTDGFADCLG